MATSHTDAENQVRSWGFGHVFTWTDVPNAHYPPHKHSGLTTHLILKGTLSFTYPNDPEPTREILGVGDRWDVDANKVHQVWVGNEGCTYVIGE
ncbi:hypothetical protein GQ44DRAFT_765736 [Phaeosphaeriaceae sp. PMI808]|nr:hypothetical protein GQ44DRAFT_765736 [Phaeosphaeriaceae sp. PMI808]